MVVSENELNDARVSEQQFVGMVRGPQRVNKMIVVLDESAAHIESVLRKREEQNERDLSDLEELSGLMSSGRLGSPKGRIAPLKLLTRRNSIFSPPFSSGNKRRNAIRRGFVD